MRLIIAVVLTLCGCEDIKHEYAVYKDKQADVDFAEHGNPALALSKCADTMGVLSSQGGDVRYSDRNPTYEPENGGYKVWLEKASEHYICHFVNSDKSVKLVLE